MPEPIAGRNVRDEVVALLGLLETTEGHLGTGDVLLGVLEVGVLEGSMLVKLITIGARVARVGLRECSHPR